MFPLLTISDQAHSTGVFGDKGKGLVNEKGIEEACFIQLHTFSKGLGSIGGKQCSRGERIWRD